jgi:hypothetical protein
MKTKSVLKLFNPSYSLFNLNQYNQRRRHRHRRQISITFYPPKVNFMHILLHPAQNQNTRKRFKKLFLKFEVEMKKVTILVMLSIIL